MKVLKFGGSSVGTPKKIENCIDIISKDKEIRAVVFSAFGGVTDALINVGKLASNGIESYKEDLKKIEERHLDTIKDLIPVEKRTKIIVHIDNEFKELEDILKGIYYVKELSEKSLDLIMSFGERLSTYIISQALNLKLECEFLDTRKIIITDNNHNNARVNYEITNKNITEYFNSHKKLQVITGFIASTKEGLTTTIGRGGSDLTASIIGAGIDASTIEIWTDVDGIMTANPHKVPDAFPINEITYEEAMELSHFGAKVIYPPTMQPAMQKEIPIIIKNTNNPEFKGTTISLKSEIKKFFLTGITSISDIALLRVQGSGMVGVAGVSKRLFGTLAKKRISVIMITQASSEHTICFAIKPEQAEIAKECLEEEFKLEMDALQIDRVVVEKDMSIIAIVGEGMCRLPGIGARLFGTLGEYNINVVATAQGSSEINISVAIDKKDEIKALNALHNRFFSKTKSIDVFLVGVGNVGGTLLKQIAQSELYNNGINIRGIANSKKMILGDVPIENWKEELTKSGKQTDIKKIIDFMENNYKKNIFVDCTASEDVAKFYKEILVKKYSIVTPNKIGNTKSIREYEDIRAMTNHKYKFLYETNVGAGLPVINTLRHLVETGDNIIKIEGVLSGTISYIFNNMNGKKFSEIVKDAYEKGYTEPDPREDLNGKDVARKILILAREAGAKIELDDINIKNLIPNECRDVKDVDKFFTKLESADDTYRKLVDEAEKDKKIVRYIATFENNKAKVDIEQVGEEHPFYFMSGTDNIVSFTTERYKDRPLVIKGPGAGAEVTAAGIFSDLIRLIE